MLATTQCGGGDGGNGPPTITAVVVSGDSTVVLAGTRQLTAAAFSGGTQISTGVTFLWTSADTNLARVSVAGLVTGRARGTVTISAHAVLNGTPTGVSGTHALRVRIGSVAPTPSTTLQFASLGDTLAVTAEARDAANAPVAGITFTAQSRNTGVVQASAANATTALVVAAGNGTTQVVVTGDGVSDSVTAAVQQIATTLSITPDTVTFERAVNAGHSDVRLAGRHSADRRGAHLRIGANHARWTDGADRHGADHAAQWDEAVDGLATADSTTSSVGVLVSVIGAVDGKADTVAIRVKQVPNSANLDPSSFGTLTAFGRQAVASCVVEDSAADTIPNHPCNWAAGTPDVVTFSPTFAVTTTITAVGNGSTTITAEAAPSLFGFDPVTWSTTNATVADVDPATGVVTTATTAGSVTITATASPASTGRTVDVVATGLTLNGSVQPILTGNCASAACHDLTAPQEGMSLVSGQTFGNTVDIAALQLASMRRVRPFRPDSSYLVHKIQGTQASVGGVGARMPEGCAGASCLPNATIDIIRNWILQGALN